jgi:two-component system phosphate regulon sensor histidine kinase PhoR
MPPTPVALGYRGRVALALVAAGLVPLLLMTLILGPLVAGLRDEQDRRLGAMAGLVAADLADRPITDSTASVIAARTGLDAALYAADGRLLASTGGAWAPEQAPALAGSTDPVVLRQAATVVVFVALEEAGGAPRGTLAMAAPEAGALGGGLDAGAVVALAVGSAVAVTLLLGWLLARALVRPLRLLAAAVERLEGGDLGARSQAQGNDELAAVAASHDRLARTLGTRDRSLGLVLGAIAELAPSHGVEAILAAAPPAATRAFGFTEVHIELVEPGAPAPPVVIEDRVPGEAWTFHTQLHAGGAFVGTLSTTLPPTRDWVQADERLLELFAIELGAAIRNAQLFAEVERLSETKSEFLRGVSHNLQTPLTSIRAIATQLAEGAPGPPGDRRLDIIVEQSDRLSRLVEQLLTVSRLEAGTLRPSIDVFAPGPLIERAWESLHRSGDGFALRDEAPGWLAAADRDRVEQVVWALLDNAVKYGRPPIEATVRSAEPADGLPEGGWLVVTIRDHGDGIPAAHRARVFERFTRLDPGGSEGTGLGLPVARGLVEAMGGRLWVAAPNGPGAAFAFSLPAEPIGEP